MAKRIWKTGKARIAAVKRSANRMAVDLLRINDPKTRMKAMNSYLTNKPNDFRLATGTILGRIRNLSDRVTSIPGQFRSSLLRTEQLERGLKANNDSFVRVTALGQKGEVELIRMKVGLIATQGEFDAIIGQLEEISTLAAKKQKAKVLQLLKKARATKAAYAELLARVERELEN
jgi:hypothetical protein